MNRSRIHFWVAASAALAVVVVLIVGEARRGAPVESGRAEASNERAVVHASSSLAPAERIPLAPTPFVEPSERRDGPSASVTRDVGVGDDGALVIPGVGDSGVEERIPVGQYRLEDGFLTILHSDGSIEEAGPWDGRWRQGYWEYFEAGGKRFLAGEYVDGKVSGRWTRWHPNGVVAEQSETLEGVFHGTRLVWNERGEMDHELSGTYVRGVKSP